jgi:hypothetical protein
MNKGLHPTKLVPDIARWRVNDRLRGGVQPS